MNHLSLRHCMPLGLKAVHKHKYIQTHIHIIRNIHKCLPGHCEISVQKIYAFISTITHFVYYYGHYSFFYFFLFFINGYFSLSYNLVSIVLLHHPANWKTAWKKNIKKNLLSSETQTHTHLFAYTFTYTQFTRAYPSFKVMPNTILNFWRPKTA